MANFPRVWSSGIGDDMEVTGSELTQLDENISKAPNASEGSEHSPTSPLLFHGVAIQFDTDGELRMDGLAHFRDGAELRLASGSSLEANAGLINLNDSAAVNAKANSFIQLFNGAHFYAQVGSTFDLEADATVDPQGSWTFEDGADLILQGTTNYPKLSTRTLWIPCRGDVTLPDPSVWVDADGRYWECNDDGLQILRKKIYVPMHLTAKTIQVRWQGASHGTWPPANRTVFTLWYLNAITAARSLLTTQSDTADQTEYESVHTLVLPSFSQGCGSADYLILQMQTEFGTNAAAGSRFISAQMEVQMTELKGL